MGIGSAETISAADARLINRQITEVLHTLVAERDWELARHQRRVARLARRVARGLKLDEGESAAVVQAAYLHDIGKLALADTLLRKAGELDAEEWKQVRQHTLIGERIITAAGASARTAAFVRSSHERFDGQGYPDGLISERIPLGARIIAVCDAYDAMTTPRPYRPPPMTDQAAMTELRRSSGAQFDPAVVATVCSLSAAEREGSQGSMGQPVAGQIASDHALQPLAAQGPTPPIRSGVIRST
jgi:two-component system, cell cycle response regulator